MAEDDVLTIKEVAKKLRVSEDTVRRMIDSGELPAFQVHRQWRIRKDVLERFMQGKQ